MTTWKRNISAWLTLNSVVMFSVKKLYSNLLHWYNYVLFCNCYNIIGLGWKFDNSFNYCNFLSGLKKFE